ncbi:hypothetical protein F4778DRAFT_729070 [Xylariomycetidae sp. FL2044]|nr:hypothetical protein F4778DRAFT_729070 [Xylariomycetidae sp. FL2044]
MAPETGHWLDWAACSGTGYTIGFTNRSQPVFMPLSLDEAHNTETKGPEACLLGEIQRNFTNIRLNTREILRIQRSNREITFLFEIYPLSDQDSPPTTRPFATAITERCRNAMLPMFEEAPLAIPGKRMAEAQKAPDEPRSKRLKPTTGKELKSTSTRTRSRNGCLKCKKNKTKCDERKPSCGRCVSRETDCSYDRALIWRGNDSVG